MVTTKHQHSKYWAREEKNYKERSYIYIHDLNAYKVDGTIKGWKANKLTRTAIKINELPVPPKGIGFN